MRHFSVVLGRYLNIKENNQKTYFKSENTKVLTVALY